MIRYTMLIALLTLCVSACSEGPSTAAETPEAIEAAQEKMAEEIKTTAEEMTEEATTEAEAAVTNE